MIRSVRLFLGCAGIAVLPSTAFAQATTTDAAQQISAMLNAHGPVVWDDTHVVEDDHTVCHTNLGAFGNGPAITCHTVKGTKVVGGKHSEILTASNIRISSASNIIFDTPTVYQLPQNYIAQSFTENNCDDTGTPTQQIAVSVTFTRSTSVTVTHSITNAIGVTIGGSYGVPGSGVSASVTASTSSTNATASLAGDQTTVTRSQQIAMQVEPKSSETVGIETWPIEYNATFHANAIVEADLSNGQELSDLYPESQRTLAINGTVGLTDAAQAVGYNIKGPLQTQYCNQGALEDHPAKALPLKHIETIVKARALAPEKGQGKKK